jgi:aryl-alcohol dehydrogenase-like predicted oxidoreductase
MEIRTTPDQEALIRAAIEAGRIHDPHEAGEQALALWAEREQRVHEIGNPALGARADRQKEEGFRSPQEAVDWILASRKNHPLPEGETIESLKNYGRA